MELQETLYNSQNPTRRWLHCTRRDWIAEKIRGANPSARSLEVGPGSGVYLPMLSKVSTELVAADIEEAYLDQARAIAEDLRSLSCVRDDITQTRLEPASFDLILCTEVIEHIVDSRSALNGLSCLLAPGGRLILTTPQRYSPLELLAKVAFLPVVIDIVRWIYREPIIPTGHVNLLTEAQLKQQLGAANLHVIEQHKCGFYLPIIAEGMGESGQRLLEKAERCLRTTKFSGLLWTQCYVLGR